MSETLKVWTFGSVGGSRHALPNPFSEQEETTSSSTEFSQFDEISHGYQAEISSASVEQRHPFKLDGSSSPKPALPASPFFDLAFRDDEHVLDISFGEQGYDDDTDALDIERNSDSIASENRAILSVSVRSESAHRGIELLSAVYAELAKHLEKTVSTADLLVAAQRLIDLSKNDFVRKEQKHPVDRPGYYSWDLVRAFSNSNPWLITEVETAKFDHCDVEEHSPETYQSIKLLVQGWYERRWDL